MRLKALLLAGLFSFSSLYAKDWKIPYIFEEPRRTTFRTIDWNKDKLDNTSLEHFLLSGVASSSLNWYFDSKKIKYPVVKSIGITLGIGLLKEFEDGYREGFSYKDMSFNILGTTLGILIYNYLKGDD